MFKEYIQKDINTFISDIEFAESVRINGVDVMVVEDHDKLDYKIKRDYEGLIVGDVLFYISSEEYAKIPKVPEKPESDIAIRYKGIPATITSVNPQHGIYEIILQYAG